MSTSSNSPAPKRDPAAVITLHPGEKPAAVDQAEEFLLPHAERLKVFQRGGEIVRIISLPELQQDGRLTRPAGTFQLESMRDVALTDILGRIIRCQRVNKDGEEQPIDFPQDIAKIYRSRTAEWRLGL